MQYDRRYNFAVSLPYLILLLFFVVFTALKLPYDNFERWIPLSAGFIEPEDIPALYSHLLSALFLIISAVSLYIFNERYLMTGKEGLTLPLTYLVLAFSSYQTSLFSGGSIATVLIMWSIHASLKIRNDEQYSFLAVFLATIASLFEPLMIYIIPLVVFFSIKETGISMRRLVLILLAFLIPVVIIFSLRFIFFNDAHIFAEEYIYHLKIGSITEPNIRSVSYLFFTIFLILLLILSLRDIFNRINRFKIIQSASFVRLIVLMFFLSGIIILYPDSSGRIMQIFSFPASVLIVESTGKNENSHKQRLYFFLVTIFLILGRIACFI